MKLKLIYQGALMTILSVSLTSCLVTKKYQSPKNVISEKLYRDVVSKDSNAIAAISWQQFFNDNLLKSYIQRGIDSNFDMMVALQNIRIAEASLKQAKAAYSPTFNAKANTGFQTLSLNTPSGMASGKRTETVQFELSGAMSWELDIWGKITARNKGALASYLNTVEAKRAVQSQLVSMIASSYYQLLSLDEQKKIIQENIILRNKTLEATKALKQSGTLTEVAVKQNEAQILNVQAQLVLMDNQIKIIENTLSILLAQEPQSIPRNSLSAQQINTSLNVGVPIQLLSNRPDVKVAEYNLMSLFEQTNVAKTNFYPTLSLTAGGGLQSIQLDKLFSLNSLFASVIGSLTQPLWNQRQIRSEYERSLSAQQIGYINFKRSILKAGQEVSNALYNYESQSQLFDLKQKEYAALDTATQYSQELMNYGMANYLEVLTAQQNALAAQLSIANAYYGRLSAMVELYRSLGGGN